MDRLLKVLTGSSINGATMKRSKCEFEVERWAMRVAQCAQAGKGIEEDPNSNKAKDLLEKPRPVGVTAQEVASM